MCFKLPDVSGSICVYMSALPEMKDKQNVSMDEAAAIEPIAVAVHAINAVARLPPHQNVVVFGAGPVGLMCMAGEGASYLY